MGRVVMFGEEPRVAGTSGMEQRQPEVGRSWTMAWASGRGPGGGHGHHPARGDGGLDPGASERTE